MIPPLFKITAKLADKYKIPRIRRVCDEKLLFSLAVHGLPTRLSAAGFAKFALMKIFGLFIRKAEGERVRFVSMLYSGAVTDEMITKTAARAARAEVMVHPGVPEMDADIDFHNETEEAYWLSDDRTSEFEACLNSATPSVHKSNSLPPKIFHSQS
jgi:hypothetical protein